MAVDHRPDDPECVAEGAQSSAHTSKLQSAWLPHGPDARLVAAAAPAKPQDVGPAPAGPFAAKFVEVRVDPDLGLVRVAREETVTDPTGRVANATLGDYLVAVNADVPDMDVLFVGEPDRFNPIGVKGIGEIGLVGIAAANAVYHATGRRIRSLPITIDKLL